MLTNPLYDTWLQWLQQLRPQERITRLRNLAWLAVGIYTSRSVHLSKVAGEIPGQAKLLSQTQRLRRLLGNAAVRVREWYGPIAKGLLQTVSQQVGEIRLIADGSKIGFGHQLLMVAVAYRKRAIPIAWTWIKGAKGHSSSYKQRALLAYVRRLVPANTPVMVVGDSEFGSVEVMQLLDSWSWQYVLRQKASHQVKLPGQTDWQPYGHLVQAPGQSLWLGSCLLTHKYAYPCHLLAHWQAGEEEPWLLATNCVTKRSALQGYQRRMWIEEMFGDLKLHGFDLESSHLRHFMRLSRLTLAVALLYVWLVSIGSAVIKNGERDLVDRADRRDLSIFQVGFRWIRRRIVNGLPIPIRLAPT